MTIKKTEKIWHNGKLIAWNEANIHVMSHVVLYGSLVFEGIRCYLHTKGPAIFRVHDHVQRLIHSAKIYRFDLCYTQEELVAAIVELVKANGVWPCHIRPLILRGYGDVGVNPLACPIEVYIVNHEWGPYLGNDSDKGVDVCVSSWTRIAPNTLPSMAKAGANYMNSQLMKMEAIVNGYAEGIALDASGYISEGSGENVFLVCQGALVTPPLSSSVLRGITRDSVIRLARDLGVQVAEQMIPREMLYIADEIFFTGTAAEITPVRSVDRIGVGSRVPGPITSSIQEQFYAIVNGKASDRFHWLTTVSENKSLR